MKKVLAYILLLPFLSIDSKAGAKDTTIHEVRVEFATPGPEAFPIEWQAAPTSANSQPMSMAEIERSKGVMIVALKKYPETLLELNLKAVYFFRYMSFFNVGYGGTNSNDALFLTNNGSGLGYTDAYLEQTFHHEFSSILFRNHPSLLDTISWKNANITGFDYNDPESGVGAIRNNQSSQELDTALCAKGFLTQYAYSSLENDINTVAQNLFRPSPGFWEIADRYPRINKKTKLLISFYGQLHSIFTESFFRQLAKK